MIGQVISHYKILEKLGEGGMGVVYKALDTQLDRVVALKFLPAKSSVTDEERERFLREARAASAINHPNVCTIYTVGEYEDPEGGNQKFIAMEFVDGGTLREKFRNGPLNVNDAVNFAIQIASALKEAHNIGIVHRDIKPDNIMINSKNQVKVMDFGLAKLKGSVNLTRASSTVGTLAYMAPEQIQGEDVDARADLFSFGVVLFEMLTGKLPFRGEHEAALVYSIVNEEPLSIRSLVSDVPDQLVVILNRCLEKDKENRYQSAKDIVADLQRFQQGEVVVQARSPGRATRYWIGGIAVAIIAIVAFFLFFPVKRGGEENASIAVLPFANMSDDKESEYFSDGVTENLITDLAKIHGLHVIARNSAFLFKGKDVDIHKAAEELHVRYILEGSIQRSNNRLRVNAQLIDASSGYHLWADRFDRELKETFAVQDDITDHIVSALRVTLTGSERQAMTSSRTTNPEAHDLYLRGRFYFNQFSGESFQHAIDYFNQAIQKDLGYAAPYAGIALTYGALADFYLPPGDAYPRAKDAALKALEIDSMNGEAHAALGVVLSQYEWNLPAGREQFRLAVRSSPNSVDVHVFSSQCAGIGGRMDEAFAEVDRAISLDPLSPVASWSKEWYYYWTHEYDKVIEQHRRTAALDSTFIYWDDIPGAAYREKGMYKEALAEYSRAQKLVGPHPLFGLAVTYARMGKAGEAWKILQALEEESSKKYIAPDQIAMVYANLGEKDKAFEWLERAYEARSAGMTALRIFPEYSVIESDPRFEAMVKKVGIEN